MEKKHKVNGPDGRGLRDLYRLVSMRQLHHAFLRFLCTDSLSSYSLTSKGQRDACISCNFCWKKEELKRRFHPERNLLVEAAKVGDCASCKYLLEIDSEYGIDNPDVNYKRTALHWAARNGHTKVVKCLVEHGAEVEMLDKFYGTPTLWACQKGQSSVLSFLVLSAGGNVNHQCRRGYTPAIFCAYNNHSECLKILLENNVDPSVTGKSGVTALGWAVIKNHRKCAMLLKAAGMEKITSDPSSQWYDPLQPTGPGPSSRGV